MASGKWIIMWEIIIKSFSWYKNSQEREKWNVKEIVTNRNKQNEAHGCGDHNLWVIEKCLEVISLCGLLGIFVPSPTWYLVLEGSWTSDHWGVNSRLDQLSHPLGLEPFQFFFFLFFWPYGFFSRWDLPPSLVTVWFLSQFRMQFSFFFKFLFPNHWIELNS